MKGRLSYVPLLITLVLCLALSACGAEEPTLVPEVEPTTADQPQPEAVEENSSPAVESTSTRVTQIAQIEGTWIAPAYPGNFVLTVFPDGKLSVATSLEDLERGSTDSWNLTIEDGQITATGYALCLGDTGSYIAEIDEEGNLRFVSIIDACDARLRKMHRSLPGRLHEYILIYHPVQ